MGKGQSIKFVTYDEKNHVLLPRTLKPAGQGHTVELDPDWYIMDKNISRLNQADVMSHIITAEDLERGTDESIYRLNPNKFKD